MNFKEKSKIKRVNTEDGIKLTLGSPSNYQFKDSNWIWFLFTRVYMVNLVCSEDATFKIHGIILIIYQKRNNNYSHHVLAFLFPKSLNGVK